MKTSNLWTETEGKCCILGQQVAVDSYILDLAGSFSSIEKTQTLTKKEYI